MSGTPKDAMLHCQVSNQLSSLSIKESSGSSTLPMYVSTQDLKLGLTTFWRSPYGTGSRKREFPTVTPSRKWNDDGRLQKSNSSSDFNIDKGMSKNCESMEPVREDFDPSRNKLRRTLRRSNSFTGDMCTSRMKRREQFSRNKSVCFSSNFVSEKPEVKEPSAVVMEDKSVPVNESTGNLRDTANTPHSASAIGSATERSITSNSADVKSSTSARPVSRIPRLTRSFSQTPTKDSPSPEYKTNSRGVHRTQSMIRSTPSARPKTCAGIRSAMLPDHTNFCNREKTVRILKWLQEVDDKQTKEGKCMELSSNLSVTIRKDM